MKENNMQLDHGTIFAKKKPPHQGLISDHGLKTFSLRLWILLQTTDVGHLN
jgi:hypothetical protein